mmetsp:Transcript_14607/g.29787  ORF Transcript_14607/g.29787 Transcript_14607/m.29787 type:complete len:82 (-) Transcript_14607:1110-1355(-)
MRSDSSVRDSGETSPLDDTVFPSKDALGSKPWRQTGKDNGMAMIECRLLNWVGLWERHGRSCRAFLWYWECVGRPFRRENG